MDEEDEIKEVMIALIEDANTAAKAMELFIRSTSVAALDDAKKGVMMLFVAQRVLKRASDTLVEALEETKHWTEEETDLCHDMADLLESQIKQVLVMQEVKDDSE